MATIPTITQDLLPEGWSLDTPCSEAVICLRAPNNRGFISIDLVRREWELGSTAHPRFPFNRGITYTGRGWLQTLINDAVAALDAAHA